MKFFVLLVIALGVLAFACGGGSSSTVYWTDLKTGDCLDSSGFTPVFTYVEKVDCVFGDVQVVEVIKIPKTNQEYPGEERMLSVGESQCSPRSEGWIVPDQEEWEDGKRNVVCLTSY